MAFETLFALGLSLAVVQTSPSTQLVTCPDGNKASNAAWRPIFSPKDDVQANP